MVALIFGAAARSPIADVEDLPSQVVAILLTDHLFSPIGTTVQQLAVARAQLVQKPCALSLHVPALLLPDSARGSRVSSPWILVAPQNGFSRLILRIRS